MCIHGCKHANIAMNNTPLSLVRALTTCVVEMGHHNIRQNWQRNWHLNTIYFATCCDYVYSWRFAMTHVPIVWYVLTSNLIILRMLTCLESFLSNVNMKGAHVNLPCILLMPGLLVCHIAHAEQRRILLSGCHTFVGGWLWKYFLSLCCWANQSQTSSPLCARFHGVTAGNHRRHWVDPSEIVGVKKNSDSTTCSPTFFPHSYLANLPGSQAMPEVCVCVYYWWERMYLNVRSINPMRFTM